MRILPPLFSALVVPTKCGLTIFLERRTERSGKLRMLKILDEYTRECLTIRIARSISSRQVIQVLDWLFLLRGAPDYLRSDNGSEFIAYALRDWLRERHCHTLYITPGSPLENPFIESLNGTFHSECLDRWGFAHGQEAQTIIEQWRLKYDHYRPHSSLGYRPPAVYCRTSSTLTLYGLLIGDRSVTQIN